MIAGTDQILEKLSSLQVLWGLCKKRHKVGVLKVGPDIRDLVPSYPIKIKWGNIRLFKWRIGLKSLKKLLPMSMDITHLILVEGVMSIFTGILNKNPVSLLKR